MEHMKPDCCKVRREASFVRIETDADRNKIRQERRNAALEEGMIHLLAPRRVSGSAWIIRSCTFCGATRAWAGKRLPTEVEWEYAARGGLVQKRYPWEMC